MDSLYSLEFPSSKVCFMCVSLHSWAGPGVLLVFPRAQGKEKRFIWSWMKPNICTPCHSPVAHMVVWPWLKKAVALGWELDEWAGQVSRCSLHCCLNISDLWGPWRDEEKSGRAFRQVQCLRGYPEPHRGLLGVFLRCWPDSCLLLQRPVCCGNLGWTRSSISPLGWAGRACGCYLVISEAKGALCFWREMLYRLRVNNTGGWQAHWLPSASLGY